MKIGEIGANNDTLSQNNAVQTKSVRFTQQDKIIENLMKQKAQLQQSLNEVKTNKKLDPTEAAQRVKDITQQISDLDQQIDEVRKQALGKTSQNHTDGSDSANTDNNKATASSGTGSDNSAAVLWTVSSELKQVDAAVALQHKMKDRIEVVKSDIKMSRFALKYQTDELTNLQSKLKPLSEYIGSRVNDIDKEERKMRSGNNKDDGGDVKTDSAAKDKKKDKTAQPAQITTNTSNQDETKQSKQALAKVVSLDVEA